MKQGYVAFGLAAVMFLFSPGHVCAEETISSDFAAIVRGVEGRSIDGSGTPGQIGVFGRASFPVLTDADDIPIYAAGRLKDGTSTDSARAVVGAHTHFIDTVDSTATSRLFVNAVLWAGGKATPEATTVGAHRSAARAFLEKEGFATKAVSTTMSDAAGDLRGCDVFVGNLHDGFSAAAIRKIKAFSREGGGLVLVATPWALSTSDLASSNEVLNLFGLGFIPRTASSETTVPVTLQISNLHNGLYALQRILSELRGGPPMDLADKRIAASSLVRVLLMNLNDPQIREGMRELQEICGWIAPTRANPIVREEQPFEAALLEYQSSVLDRLEPAHLAYFRKNPIPLDIPGQPDEGAVRVTRTVTVDIKTAPPDYPFMYQANRPTRLETGLYAGPGDLITITLPPEKVDAGFQVHIGGTEDTIFNRPTWTSYPKLWRRMDLSASVNRVGHALGGLITLLVPPGSDYTGLAAFDVEIANALPAPHFIHGQHRNKEWNATLKHHSAPWGYLQTPKVTVYIPAWQLEAVTDMETIATHWDKLMNLGDEFFGTGPYRQRAEVLTTKRQTRWGLAYASYPIENGWGVDSEAMLGNTLNNGSWGNYHELGHTYQAKFKGGHQNMGVATHAEIDVNLFPVLLYTHLHGRTAWDNNTSTFWDAEDRIFYRDEWLTRLPEERTWDAACKIDGENKTRMANDFYFNLFESFGFPAYSKAFSRLMDWYQNERDPAIGRADVELSALDQDDPNYRRNRFYLLMCDATERNLDDYFQFYGLGVPGRGFDITQSVKDWVATKAYPVWTGNQPLTSLSNPGFQSIAEDALPGTVIVERMAATDPDPGTIFSYRIAAGNDDNRFAIDRRTGEVRVIHLDYETNPRHELTIVCEDNGIPRHSLKQTFSVEVRDVQEATRPSYATLSATSTMAPGTVIGKALHPDVSTGITASVVSGAPEGAFSVDARGNVVLEKPGVFTEPTLLTLKVQGTDTQGEAVKALLPVLVNTQVGLAETRWAGQTIFDKQAWSVEPSYFGILSNAESESGLGPDYTRRLVGWLVPPVSGDYTFWISSDDRSRLFLGRNAGESSRKQIASLERWTPPGVFDKHASQRSAMIPLEAGQAYWFEIHHVQGGGHDHLAVAWQHPRQPERAVIRGEYFIPYLPGLTAPDSR